MARLASPLQFLSPQLVTISPTSPIHQEKASSSWVWVEELTSPRDPASNFDTHPHQLPSQFQQQSPPDVHEKVASIRRLRWMLEETKKVNTQVTQDIFILEAALRELAESVSPPPEFEQQYSTVFPSIWTLKPDEILYGNGLILPSLPSLVRHETRRRHAPPLSSPGWPQSSIAPHCQSPAQSHVSSPQSGSQVRVDSEAMLYQIQPPPPATISTESVTFQENVGMRSPQRHEAQDLPAPRTIKYTIPSRRQDPQPQVESTGE